MFLMERHENICLSELAAFVEQCMLSGARIVVVSRNVDGYTYTVSVQRD